MGNLSGRDELALAELQRWLGRPVPGRYASQCPATDAECLKRIRDSGAHRLLGLTWDEFCKRHGRVSRATADRIILRLERFGADYFHLAQFIRLSPGRYRLIAGSISGGCVEYGGERIPITRRHAAQVVAAIRLIETERVRAELQVKELRAALRGVRTRFGRDRVRKELASVLDGIDELLARLADGGDRLPAADWAVVACTVERIGVTVRSIAA